jgi:hypothetical protein
LLMQVTVVGYLSSSRVNNRREPFSLPKLSWNKRGQTEIPSTVSRTREIQRLSSLRCPAGSNFCMPQQLRQFCLSVAASLRFDAAHLLCMYVRTHGPQVDSKAQFAGRVSMCYAMYTVYPHTHLGSRPERVRPKQRRARDHSCPGTSPAFRRSQGGGRVKLFPPACQAAAPQLLLQSGSVLLFLGQWLASAWPGCPSLRR